MKRMTEFAIEKFAIELLEKQAELIAEEITRGE